MKEKKLIDICGIQYGYPFDSSRFSSNPEDGMPLVRIRDVKEGKTNTYYKGDYPKEYVIHRGDYLVGMDGEFNIAPWGSSDALLNQRVCKVASKTSDVSNGYLFRFLTKELKRIEDETPFVTVKHLSAKRLNQVHLLVPSLEEQERIVAELDLLSGIIDKQKQQLKELDTLAQSIFYDMFGNPVENDKGWKTSTLKDVAPQKSYTGIIPSIDGKYWVLNLDMVAQQTGEVISKVLFDKDDIGSSTMCFDTSNVLYSKLRPYLNKVVLPDAIGYGTTELVPLKPNPSLLNRVFLAYLLRSKAFVDYISVKVAGAKMPRVSMDVLRLFPIILPQLALQKSFAEKIAAIEQQKDTINRSIVESQKLFDYTMDKYFG